MKRHNYKKLKIWQASLKSSFLVCNILENFPKYECYDLTSQINKCSISLETQISITHHKKYINNKQLQDLENLIAE